MKIATALEMREIDRITIEKTGIPGEVLMGYAGKSIADYIRDNLRHVKRVVVFCGTGNNGGDGFVIAYFLANTGYGVDVYLSGNKEKVTETSKVYLKVCLNSGINIVEVNGENISKIDFKGYDLIIDSMLGTGFQGKVSGIIEEIIERINKSGIMTLSVDIPSGLPSDGEAPDGAVVRADYTVTIGLPKISLVTYPGRDYTGALHVADIGFPSSLTGSDELSAELIDENYARKKFDFTVDSDAHKGKNGHLLIIGGFDYMEGAAIMAARSALETGIGLVTALTTPKARSIIAGRVPELITASIFRRDAGYPDPVNNNHSDLIRDIESGLSEFFGSDRKYDVIVIGPGMGRSVLSQIVFRFVINNLDKYGIKRVLIDGDGLYHLSEYLKSGKLPGKASFVITPHFSEASRLLGVSVDQIKNNRLKHAVELSGMTAAVALLKGPSTIISDGNKTLINTSGNSALATAGSGDVLSGITGALLLRKLDIIDAAGVGAYIHGLAADVAVNKIGPNLKATDIIDFIREAIKAVVE